MKKLFKIKSKLLIIIISMIFIIIYTVIKLNTKVESKQIGIQNYMTKKSNEELEKENISVNDCKVDTYNKVSQDLISNYVSNENLIINDELNENEFYSNEIINKNSSNNNNQYLNNSNIGANSNQSLVQNQLQAELQNNTSNTKNQISNGVNIEYLDINNKKMVSVPEKIYGEIDETYNVQNLDKKIKDYTLVSVEGEREGKLKLEKINIQYNYAKTSKIKIKYIDRDTGNEIASTNVIEGYEGKPITINEKMILGYNYESGAVSGKMLAGEYDWKIYYTKNVEENKKEQNEKINQEQENQEESENQRETENKNESENQENSEDQEASKEKQEENPGEQKLKEEDNDKNDQCTVNIKYVDIDNDKILYQEKATGEKGSKVKIKLKEIEGYNLIADSYDDESNNNINIIDELINSMIDSEKEKSNINRKKR